MSAKAFEIIAANCALVTIPSGLKVPSPMPFTIPFSYMPAISCAAQCPFMSENISFSDGFGSVGSFVSSFFFPSSAFGTAGIALAPPPPPEPPLEIFAETVTLSLLTASPSYG